MPDHCEQEVFWGVECCGCSGWQNPRDGKINVLNEKETGFLLITDFKLLNQMKGISINYCDF